MKIETQQLRVPLQSHNLFFIHIIFQFYKQGLKISVLKYSAIHFPTAQNPTNPRTLCNNIKINQNFYIDSTEPNLKFRTAKKIEVFFFLTTTRKVLTTISLFLGVSNVKLTVCRPSSSGRILNVTAEEEPASRFLN